jgi:PASTA domain
MDSGSPPPTETRRNRDWIWKVVVPITVSVLGALLIGALTPVGAAMRETLFPTKAFVTGRVVIGSQPAAGAHVTLDGNDERGTDADGKLYLLNVRAGTHILHVDAGAGASPASVEFSVDRGAVEKDLDVIQLAPLVQLGFFANIQFPIGFTLTGSYNITLWLVGEPDTMANIDSVTYTLPSPLSASGVRGGSRGESFCYRQTGPLDTSQIPLGGTFTAALATVGFSTGESIQLSAPPGQFSPPECEEKHGQPVGPPSPPPSMTWSPPPQTSASMAPSTIPPPSTATPESGVPNLICQRASAAKNMLTQAGLNPIFGGTMPILGECPGTNRVVAQDPAPGTLFKPGDSVTYWTGASTPSP